MKLKASIVIPVYNAERTLKNCLESVFNQTYTNYEVIVVNNNSTDKTDVIVKYFQKNYKFEYLFEKQRSRGAARQTGEKKARGDIILMTDSDCIVPKDWIENIVKSFNKGNYDAVQGFQQSVAKDFWSRQIQIRSERKIDDFNNRSVIGMIDTKNFAIKKISLKKVDYSGRKYVNANDSEFSIRFYKHNLKLKFLKEVKVLHHHPNSFKKIVCKYFDRAFWCVTIANDYEKSLRKTDFMKRTNQTFWSFIKFFPGLFKTFFTKGFKYTYFDLVTGLAWRVGIIYGKIKNFQ